MKPQIIKKNDSIKDYSNVTNFDELLDVKYGKPSTPARVEFHRKAQLWIIG